MRSPAHFRPAVEDDRGAGTGTAGAVHSANAVLWEIGLVLAVFLGLAVTLSATLITLGLN